MSNEPSMNDLAETLRQQEKEENQERTQEHEETPKDKDTSSPNREENRDGGDSSRTSGDSVIDQLKTGPAKKPSKAPATFNLTTDLVERLRDACYWERLVLSQVVELSIRDTIEKMEDAFNDGDRFPEREDDLPTSRPGR